MSEFLSKAEQIAARWRKLASDRRDVSPVDQVADAFDFCARTMLEDLSKADADDEELTPAEYGDLPHVKRSDSQVRRWCKQGLLPHRKVGADFLIRRGAQPPVYGVRRAS